MKRTLLLFATDIKSPFKHPTPSQKQLLERLSQLKTECESKLVPVGFLSRFKTITPTRGLYIYGGVGQGKTVLMDSFYEAVNVPKHRIHFHEFMLRIHKQLHGQKTLGSSCLDLICNNIVKEYKLLCLDEFHVAHISDAMILKGLFSNLFKRGLVLVCTSNRAPNELYWNGLNRQLFLPFIPVLETYCDVFNLVARDFRERDTSKESDAYLVTNDKRALEKLFLQHHPQGIEYNKEIPLSPTRSIIIKASCGDSCYVEFDDVCGTDSTSSVGFRPALGNEGYMAICTQYTKVYLANVPQLDAKNPNDGRLRSFMLFVDHLYENNVKLYQSAPVPLILLFGIHGIIKTCDEFAKALVEKFPEESDALEKYKNPLDKRAFHIMAKDVFGNQSTDPENFGRLYTALLQPHEEVLDPSTVYQVCCNHLALVKGKLPKTPLLYKLDVYDAAASENEFACSRTLSRLFHMTSSTYGAKAQ